MQQYLAHKGAEAESFFVILRGEAQECLKLMLNDTNNPTGGSGNHHPDQQHSLSHLTSDARGGGVQQCVTVELTYLGKFDIAGEYLGAEKKTLTCPVDIRAVTDVDCLVLSVSNLLITLMSYLISLCFSESSLIYILVAKI